MAHIDGIGINSRKMLENEDITTLEKHFMKFLNPRNMFLIPKKYAGIAELEEFLKEM